MMGSGAGSLYYMGNGALPRLGVRPDGAGALYGAQFSLSPLQGGPAPARSSWICGVA